MKILLRLSKLVSPLFPVMILAIVLGTLGFFCAIGIPVLGTMALFKMFPAKFLVLVGVARGIFHYFEQYCNHFIAFSLLARIRNIVFEKLRFLGPARLETKEKGNLIALLTSDIELLEVFYAHTISPVCIAILVSLGMAAFFVRYSFVLAAAALFFYMAVGILIPFFVSGPALKYGSAYRKNFAEMNSFLLDCLRGISMSIMYGTGAKKLSEIQAGSESLSRSKMKMSEIEGISAAVSGFAVVFASVAVLLISIFLHAKNLLSFESVVICTVAMFSSFGPVIAVANLGSGLSQTVASGKRILDLLDEKPFVRDVIGGKNVVFDGAKAENVSFSYGKQNSLKNCGKAYESENLNVLENFSAEFSKGKIIGIQGKSGSGKSTLLKLFMHFWEADKGGVFISGEDVRKINTDNLRKIESYFTQETVLFHDTIINNIRIAKLDSTGEEIAEACRKANIHDFIESLPKKYETQVSELGDNFSGGERQRLGLARAFLHGGDFLILDEPTSNLDSWNEKIIMESVKKFSAGKTVVIVSHRKSTFYFADKIVKINSGRNS